jgi:hypothetical protein
MTSAPSSRTASRAASSPSREIRSAPATRLRKLAAFAEERGLRIAVFGASEHLRPTYEQLGLHSLYMGDEAIVETAAFSLEGRAIRKVRQSVSRLCKAATTSRTRSYSSHGTKTVASAGSSTSFPDSAAPRCRSRFNAKFFPRWEPRL